MPYDGPSRDWLGGRRKSLPSITGSESGAGVRPALLAFREIEAGLLHECLLAVIDAGGAILFGVTSDGGAVSITIYQDGDRRREYCTNVEQLAACLAVLRTAFSRARGDGGSTPTLKDQRPRIARKA